MEINDKDLGKEIYIHIKEEADFNQFITRVAVIGPHDDVFSRQTGLLLASGEIVLFPGEMLGHKIDVLFNPRSGNYYVLIDDIKKATCHCPLTLMEIFSQLPQASRIKMREVMKTFKRINKSFRFMRPRFMSRGRLL